MDGDPRAANSESRLPQTHGRRFDQDPLRVGFDGSNGDLELSSDRFVAFPFVRKPQNFDLAWRKWQHKLLRVRSGLQASAAFHSKQACTGIQGPALARNPKRAARQLP